MYGGKLLCGVPEPDEPVFSPPDAVTALAPAIAPDIFNPCATLEATLPP